MSEDKYTARLNSVLKNKEISKQKDSALKYKQEYKNAIKNLKEGNIYGKAISVNDYFMDYIANHTAMWIQDRGEGWVAKFANEGFKKAIDYGDISMAINAYRIYENLGRGKSPSVKNRLLKALDKSKKVSKENIHFVQDALVRNPSSKNLEKSLFTSVFAGFAVAGLFFGFSSLTGAAIGFSKSFSLTGGVALFVVGILGLFFGRKL